MREADAGRAQEIIMRVRARSGLSAGDFARLLGVSPTTVYYWEWGTRRVGMWSIYRTWARGAPEAARLAGEIIQEFYRDE